jgi:hypothetical protein
MLVHQVVYTLANYQCCKRMAAANERARTSGAHVRCFVSANG